jgi:hypothetical protein
MGRSVTLQTEKQMPTWKELRPWLDQSMAALDCHATALAKKAGIVPSTLLRGLNNKDPNYNGRPRDETLERLAAVSPIPLPPIISGRDWVKKPGRDQPQVKTAPEVFDLRGEDVVIEIRIRRAKPVDQGAVPSS